MHHFIRTITSNLHSVTDSLKQKSDYVMGTVSAGGVGAFMGHENFNDWLRPVILSIVCAIAGLTATHYGKKVLKWLDKKIGL
jgi:hypothetical protein